MSLRARRTALATALLLAVPAGPALAQSPGDSQYTDPLAGESADSAGSSGSSGGSGSSGSGGSSGSSGSAGSTGTGEGLSTTPPATAAEGTDQGSASATAGAAASGAAATGEGRNRLPDTGADLWILGVLGGGLLLAGGALRLRTAR